MRIHRLYTVLTLCAILFLAAAPMAPVTAAQDSNAVLQITVKPDPGNTGALTSAVESVGFTITVTNTSNLLADNVVVTEALDPDVDWKVDMAGCSISAAGQLTCRLGDLPGGKSVAIHIDGSAQEIPCECTSAVTAQAANALPVDAPVDLSTGGCPVMMAITKTASSTQVNPGELIEFTINTINNGYGTAYSVITRDVLPVGPGLSWSITLNDQNACRIVSGELICNYAKLLKGEFRRVTVTSPTPKDTCGLITNTATTSAYNEVDYELDDNEATAEVNVLCPGGVDVAISKLAEEETVDLGELVQFNMVVTNNGSTPAAGVTLTDELPGNTVFVWELVNPVEGCEITEGVLTCDFGTLAGGASKSVSVSSLANSCGEVNKTATVAAEGEPADKLANNTANASVKVNCSDGVNVMVTKTTPKPGISQGEMPVQFTMTVSSNGTLAADGVTLTDTLPDISGLSWKIEGTVPGCGITAGVLTCKFGTLAPGEERTVTITSPSMAAEGLIENTAVVSATNETAGNGGDNQASAEVNIAALACLNLNIFNGIYSNTFEDGLPGQIGVKNYLHSVAPKGQQFMGDYGNQTVSLTVGCLPPHEEVLISFDLYIIRSWDGNATAMGPDHWRMELETGAAPLTLVDTTFTNWQALTQSYPGTWVSNTERPDNPAQSGAIAKQSLGYIYNKLTPADAVYHISMIVPHSGELATFNFTGSGLQTLVDESWGLDNITVVPIGSNRYYLPVMSR